MILKSDSKTRDRSRTGIQVFIFSSFSIIYHQLYADQSCFLLCFVPSSEVKSLPRSFLGLMMVWSLPFIKTFTSGILYFRRTKFSVFGFLFVFKMGFWFFCHKNLRSLL